MPSRNTEKPITRKDIAELLGVSVSVVSRALNNSGYVEEKLETEDHKDSRRAGICSAACGHEPAGETYKADSFLLQGPQ